MATVGNARHGGCAQEQPPRASAGAGHAHARFDGGAGEGRSASFPRRRNGACYLPRVRPPTPDYSSGPGFAMVYGLLVTSLDHSILVNAGSCGAKASYEHWPATVARHPCPVGRSGSNTTTPLPPTSLCWLSFPPTLTSPPSWTYIFASRATDRTRTRRSTSSSPSEPSADVLLARRWCGPRLRGRPHLDPIPMADSAFDLHVLQMLALEGAGGALAF